MSERSWRKSEVHEALLVLYLRLNGYFTTGLVAHAPEWGHNRTEIDCLAIRHPHHAQPEREVSASPFLALWDGYIDVLICEVKSEAAQLAFSQRLRDHCDVLESVLRWLGVFCDEHVRSVAERLRPMLQTGVDSNLAREGVAEGTVRVRGLLCGPPCTEAQVQGMWCLVGAEILRFTHECFNPPEPRKDCSTRYNFRLWGRWLAPLVEYFKEDVGPKGTPTLEGLYERLGAT